MTTVGQLAIASRRLAAAVEHLPPGGIELAYHAAVPVVVDPDLLHLIRLNFLVDADVAVSYETEAALLLSPLFREMASGLFEIDPDLRNLLLLGLNSAFPHGRVEEVALLLYRYTLKPGAWGQFPSLSRAQHLTAYLLLDPAGCARWLDRNQASAGFDPELDEKWFVAMRQHRENYPPAEATFDGVVDQTLGFVDRDRLTSIGILRSLAKLPGAARAAQALGRLTDEDHAVVTAAGTPAREVGDSPTMARRRVRRAIREAREESGRTQQEVANVMEWSLSKVIRIENGDVSIAPYDLRPLLSFVGVKDKSVVFRLLDLAKVARVRQRRSWSHQVSLRRSLSSAYQRLIEYEADAAVIRCWTPLIVPDLLQTRSYSNAVLGSVLEDADTEVAEARMLAQTGRRDAFLARSPAPAVAVVLDEAAVRRRLGGADVHQAQMRDLHRLIRQQRVKVRVLPFEGWSVGHPLAFELLEFGGGDGQAVYLTDTRRDEIIEDAGGDRYRRIHDRLWRAALDVESSARMIAEAMD